MELWKIIFIIGTIIGSALFFLLAILSFLEKGLLLNNTYDKDKLNSKKPYYIQTGILFVLVGLLFLGVSLFLFTDLYKKITLPYVLIFAGIIFIYVLASTIYISSRNKRE